MALDTKVRAWLGRNGVIRMLDRGTSIELRLDCSHNLEVSFYPSQMELDASHDRFIQSELEHAVAEHAAGCKRGYPHKPPITFMGAPVIPANLLQSNEAYFVGWDKGNYFDKTTAAIGEYQKWTQQQIFRAFALGIDPAFKGTEPGGRIKIKFRTVGTSAEVPLFTKAEIEEFRKLWEDRHWHPDRFNLIELD